MADFCHACTPPEWAERNDFVHVGEAYWALCEGCGIHLFRFNGKRACARPQSDFENDELGYTPAWPDACAKCIEREDA